METSEETGSTEETTESSTEFSTASSSTEETSSTESGPTESTEVTETGSTEGKNLKIINSFKSNFLILNKIKKALFNVNFSDVIFRF